MNIRAPYTLNMFIDVLNKSNNYIKYGIIVIIVLYCCLCYSVFWLLDIDTLWEVATENHVIENMATIYLFICAILSLVLFVLSKYGKNGERTRYKKNLWFLLLGIVFLFGVGEEISWGQNFFNIPVPEKLKQINVQEELNIHNIIYFNSRDFNNIKKPLWQRFYTFNVAYIIFGLGFCFLVPLFHRVSNSCSRWLEYFRIPLVPLGIGVIFIVTYLITRVTNFFLDNDDLIYPSEEIREHIWAFLFLVIFMRWFINQVQVKTMAGDNKCRHS